MSLISVRHLLLLGLPLIPLYGMADSNGADSVADTPVLQAADGQAASVPKAFVSPQAVDLNALLDLKRIISRLAEKRVVFIGETHDRYDHHLNQLALIQRLHEANPQLVVALEFFQQPFQPYLDGYIAGKIDERTFLEKTEYFERWGYDYRLYRPIIEYARQHSIPLLALNVPGEISEKVGQVGLDGLTPEEKAAWVPEEIDRSDKEYRERLHVIYSQHPSTKSGDFERFYQVQLLWDETMAARAARYLKENPGRQMVLLAGVGHLVYGAGIPRRLVRRMPVGTAIVLQGGAEDLSPEMGDFLLFSRKTALSPAGRLGVALSPPGNGVRVESLIPDSGAAQAGMRAKDRIVAIDGQGVSRLADLKFALMDKRPGEHVRVKVARESVWPIGSSEELELNVTLQ